MRDAAPAPAPARDAVLGALRREGAPAVDARALGRTALGIALGLTAFGLVMIYSWTAVGLARVRSGFDPERVLLKQVGWVAVALLACFVASRIPLATVRRHVDLLLGLLLLALALTLVPGVGLMRNNSRRWLEVGPFAMQASEFVKIAVVLYLADRIARREEDLKAVPAPWLGILAPVGIAVVLVLSEPDLGTSLFLVATSIVMLGLAGVRPGRLLPYAALALPLLVVVASLKFRHVGERLSWFAHGAKGDPQQWNGVVALGSGGWTGVGLGAGTQKLGRVPEMQNDFIFTLIGEELGFVGCATVILAFMAFVVYGRRIAERAHASAGLFPYYVAAGATFAPAFQAMINIAVATGSAPNKGVSLPFISVGGSNLVTAFAAVGLLLNVARTVSANEGGDPWA